MSSIIIYIFNSDVDYRIGMIDAAEGSIRRPSIFDARAIIPRYPIVAI